MKSGGWWKVRRRIVLLAVGCFAAAGCSSLPGLRVLTGQDTGTAADSAQTVQSLDLVMADKSGTTDPSLYAAADRIEAADRSVDIIEIRQDVNARVFEVDLLVPPPQDATQASQIAFFQAIFQGIEVTWQAVLPESESSDTLRVVVLIPEEIPTLDNGPSFVGGIFATAEISRGDAAVFLSRSHTLTDFIDLIANGKLNFQQATSSQLYTGRPNHPMWMLPNPASDQSQQ
jgi:hypothetical protein